MRGHLLRDARRLTAGSGDWREAIWNKWLIGYLTPRHLDEEEKTESDESRLGAEEKVKQTADSRRGVDTVSNEGVRMNASASCSPHASGSALTPVAEESSHGGKANEGEETTNSSTEPSDGALFASRRAEAARARLDRLLEQMDVVEQAVDRIADRQSVASSHDRLQLRSMTDLLDRLVEMQERHTDTLVACTRALERLERRMLWSERQSRLSVAAEEGSETPDLGRSDSVVPASIAPASMIHRARQPSESRRSGGESVAPVSGQLNDISLPTLLSMAELERWTGRLTLEVETHTVQVDLEAGLLVGVLEDDSPSDAVEALYDLVEMRVGKFSFTPSATVMKTEPAPLTVGSLLLRAGHRRDELSRAGS